MELVLVFGAALAVAVLFSERARTTVLSATVFFLAVGAALGPGLAGLFKFEPGHPLLRSFAEIALFTILYVDTMALPARELLGAWRLPTRALVLALPLTLGAIALLARWLPGFTWLEACLVGAVLAPTDPVFATALIQQESVPERLRKLLTIESGLNDGLVLPVVVVLIELSSAQPVEASRVILEIFTGVGLGIALPLVVFWLEKLPFLGAREEYRVLSVVAVGFIVYGLKHLLPLNEFLGAFAAGTTIATVSPRTAEEFEKVGEPLAEAIKLFAVMLFGALITPRLLGQVGAMAYVFAALVLLAARPLAFVPSFAGSGLDRREWLAAAWFGPKGFASVLYGLLALRALGGESRLFGVVALVTAASIVAHSSTDVLVARWFQKVEQEKG